MRKNEEERKDRSSIKKASRENEEERKDRSSIKKASRENEEERKDKNSIKKASRKGRKDPFLKERAYGYGFSILKSLSQHAKCKVEKIRYQIVSYWERVENVLGQNYYPPFLWQQRMEQIRSALYQQERNVARLASAAKNRFCCFNLKRTVKKKLKRMLDPLSSLFCKTKKERFPLTQQLLVLKAQTKVLRNNLDILSQNHKRQKRSLRSILKGEGIWRS